MNILDVKEKRKIRITGLNYNILSPKKREMIQKNRGFQMIYIIDYRIQDLIRKLQVKKTTRM